MCESRRQRAEDRGQKTGVRGQKAEDRRQKTDLPDQSILISAFCPLTPVFSDALNDDPDVAEAQLLLIHGRVR